MGKTHGLNVRIVTNHEMEDKIKHILQQEVGNLPKKKGLHRMVAIEKVFNKLLEEVFKMDNKIKLLEGRLDLLQ